MKNSYIVFFIIFFLFSLGLFATSVTQSQSDLIARGWSDLFYNGTDFQDVVIKEIDEEAVLYIYCFNSGWVMISADDSIKPILGFSFQTAYLPDTEPSALLSLFKNYTSIIKTSPISQSLYASEWSDLLSGDFRRYRNQRVVEPLIPVLWSQNWPYNAYCPLDPEVPGNYNGHHQTSCGPTAFSQILKYWEFPDQGNGYHSYYYDDLGLVEADFGSTTYNWQNMPVSLDFDDPETVYSDVATLMLHCGVSVDDSYGSGASLSKYTAAAVKYFRYNPSCRSYYYGNFSETEWRNLIRQDLNNGFPIMIEGQAEDSVAPWEYGLHYGHYFICDGYYGEDFYHINWGWGGSSNGYYPLYEFGNNLSNGGFNLYNHALLGLQPNSDDTELILSDPYTIDDHTVVLLHFDGDYSNESSQTEDSTPHGSYLSFVDNSALGLGQCLYLNNSNQNNSSYLSIPDNDNLDLSGDWTIEMWFKPLSIGNNWNEKYTLLNKPLSSDYYRSNYLIHLLPSSDFESGALLCSYSSTENVDKTPELVTDRYFPELGNWYHLAYIRDTSDKSVKLLVHNSSRELVHYEWASYYEEVHAQPLLNTSPLYIGTSLYSNSCFNGYIDELRISNVVRNYYDGLSADFAIDINSGEAPLTVNFIDRSLGSPTLWQWDFQNDGIIDSNEQNPTFTYTQAGIYNVSLTVSDGSETNTQTKSGYITVTENYPTIPALLFDGQNDFAIVENFFYPTGDITIEAWIKPAQFGSLQEVIYGINPENNNTVQFRIEEDGRLLYGESPNWAYIVTPTSILLLNEWNHVAIVRDSGLGRLYINGILQVEGIVNEGVNPTIINLGGRVVQMDRFYSGFIADLRMWNIALSQTDLQENMNNFLSGSEAGLIAYWRLNEGSGQTITDFSGNGHNLQLGSQPGADQNDPQWIATHWPYFWTLLADFTSDVAFGEAPLTVQFNDLSLGSPTTWEWDFQNDGTIDSFEQNPEWIFTEAGIYSVSLTISDLNSQFDCELKEGFIAVTPTTTENHEIPLTFSLSGNYPNPFNPITTITFQLPADCKQAELTIFNLKGQIIRSFPLNSPAYEAFGNKTQNLNSLTWDGYDDHNNPVASGIYLYQLKTERWVQVRKMMLLK